MRIVFFILAVMCGGSLIAQVNPVKWSFDAEKVGESVYEITLTANIEAGWSVYSQHIDQDAGPVPTSIRIESNDDILLLGDALETGVKKEGFDQVFGTTLIKYTRRALFRQRIKVENGTPVVKGSVTFMTCDDQSCLPPESIPFQLALH